MKIKILNLLIPLLVTGFPLLNFSQTPTLGKTADFVLFTSVGAVTNTGITHLTGNVGTNSGSSTGFGNVDGGMHDGGPVSAQCATDLGILYGQLNAVIPTFFPAVGLGNGQTLVPGIYSIPSPATLDLEIILDGQNDPSSVFIIQINGAFSTHALSKVTLINGALACNVFWKVEGLVDMAPGTTMRGTVLANNAAINMNAGDKLEGRLLSINGAITLNNSTARIPDGCGSPHLVGPIAPNLVSAACYALFSADGAVSNVGITNLKGDVGTNNGLTVGFNPLLVNGNIHPIPDVSTAACASDLITANAYLTALPFDIELLYPAQFGNSLVLTPHTYIMNAAVALTDTLFLNAKGDSNAVFVFQIYGALSTSTYANVVLLNGAKSKNVYWKVNGAVDINDYSTFRGTVICHNGAMILKTGVMLDGRALTTTGALSTDAMTAITPTSCAPQIATQPVGLVVCAGSVASFSVVANGVGLTYQWRKGSVNLANNAFISGVNTAVLTIDPTTINNSASNYNVIVSGTYTPIDTSNFVALVINTTPVISLEPVNQTTCSGTSVSFTTTATGTGLSYQWRKGNTNLTNTGNVSGALTNTLTINPAVITDTASNYYLVVSGTCSPNDTSNIVSLKINTVPAITLEPVNQIACSGTSISFTTTATGTGLSYQWRKGNTNLTNTGNVTGALTNTLTINPAVNADTASNYYVVVSGTCSPNDTSNIVSLKINALPVLTLESVNQTACSGTSISFTTTATGTGLSYQWRKGNSNLTNTGNISGALTNTLTINPAVIADTASNYYLVVSGTCSPNDTSNLVSLKINTLPVITLEPVNQTACSGTSVSFTTTVTGTGLSYQWRKGNTNLTNTGNVSGALTNTLTINPAVIADSASNYYLVDSGTCSPNDTSNLVSLKINTLPVITLEPVNQTACSGTSVSFTTTVTGTGLSFQWRKGNTNLTNTGNVTGALTNTLTINPAVISDTASNYYLVVSGTCTPNDTSNVVSLKINSLPIISLEPENQTACSGTSVSFNTIASGSGLTYQWRKGSTNLTNTGNISGVLTNALTFNYISTSDSSSSYNVIVSGTCLPADTSKYVSLVVNEIPIAVATSVYPVATGDTIFLFADTVIGAIYAWKGPNNFSSSLQRPIILSAASLNSGSYILHVTKNACSSLGDTTEVMVMTVLKIHVDLSVIKTASSIFPFKGKNMVFTIVATNNSDNDANGVKVTEKLNSGFTYISSNVTAGTFNPITGEWNIGTLAKGKSEIMTITVLVNRTGIYKNSVTITGNESDTLTTNNISSSDPSPTDFLIPEGFSPNGDGINDLFVIRGILNYPNNSLEIYNRWGGKVYKCAPYKNTWDGTNEMEGVGGHELPSGTYFYLLNLGDDSTVLKGTIYLTR